MSEVGPHGTVGTYVYWKCRCGPCKAAKATAAKEYRLAHPEIERRRKHDWLVSNRERNTERSRAWVAENPENYDAIQFRSHLGRHGISPEDYDALLKAQDGRCAGCGVTLEAYQQDSSRTRRFSVDHDHACCPGTFSCGRCIRGLLCMVCNFADRLA